MGLFRKKEEDAEGEYVEQDELENTSLKRIKRINTRKKETVRPWTKSDRLVLFYLLTATVVVSTILSLSSYDWKVGGLPKIKVPSFDLSYFKTSTIILENDNPNIPSRETMLKEKITSEFKKGTAKLSGSYAFYFVDLKTGFSFGEKNNDEFLAASLIKLPAMVAFYKEKGGELDTSYTLSDIDKSTGSGSLSSKPTGYKIKYRDLLLLMGKESDNTALKIVRKLIGDEKINSTAKSIGMINTDIVDNSTTPADIGKFFTELYKRKILGDAQTVELLDFLTDTIYEQYLPKLLPDDIRVAHKYGREIHIINDAGIIYSNNPYVLVIMTKGIIDKEGDTFIPELSKTIYDIAK